MLAVHSVTTPSASALEKGGIGWRGWTANAASRMAAPSRRATARAARTSWSLSSVPVYATVSRVTLSTSPVRKPRVARATGTGELCSSRSATLLSVIYPK